MKKGLFLLLMFVASLSARETDDKIWVSTQYQAHGDRIIFIQDRETGTRCYAITSSVVTTSGYAISCVKGEK